MKTMAVSMMAPSSEIAPNLLVFTGLRLLFGQIVSVFFLPTTTI